MRRIKLYSSSSCTPCKRLKEWLENRAIAYEEVSLDDDPQAQEELRTVTGQLSVPVLIVDDRFIFGFSPTTLNEVFG